MVIKSSKYFLFGIFFIAGILFSLNFVVADFTDCWAKTGTDNATCVAVSGCQWKTQAEDPWCDDSAGCCMDIGCWDYGGTDEITCTNVSSNGGLNCTWDPFFEMYWPNNDSVMAVGGCVQDWSGDETWVMDGCWQYDGDKAACGINSCNWKPNDANQNTWCGVKSFTDAQNKNSDANASVDIGCCEQTGCWSYDNNETLCGLVFDGLCFYENSSFGGGWCMSQGCYYANGNETQCNTLKNSLYMPCTWNNDSGQEACEDSFSDGGFGFYEDSDDCFEAGGWYNSTGDCVMPFDGGFGEGDGGFLFGGEATCWFADNQENVCGNITGCTTCVAGSGPSGVDNSSNNICYRKQVGYCEGHDVHDLNSYYNANNSASLTCVDVNIKSACNYGPLPNCKWTNSSINVGTYCIAGTSSERKAEPPVPYCEHPDSKNNYSMCMQLATDYMMPCKWDNSSYPVLNCTFNGNAVFGDSGEQDFEMINSDTSCVAAGGTWNTEFYVDGAILKQDSWCEMTGFFDVDNGGAEGNKGNCDTSCWACEFQSDGSAWENVTRAQDSCIGSDLGYCQWTADNYSYSGFGRCDYPAEMEDAGGMDCNTECGGCDFMISPVTSCEASVANAGEGCKWVNDTNNAVGGYCVSRGKKTCESDCFSCFDNDACYASSLSCTWEDGLCQPQGFDGEICFDGVDNDGDLMIDCGDPDCGFDNFCGGASIGGDCFAQMTEGTCNQTFAFDLNDVSLNCSWINDTWNSDGWCDMPGMNCWKFDDDMAACGAEVGCTNDSSSMGGADSMCDINKTKMDTANCWQWDNATCDSKSSCQWTTDPWCADPQNINDTWCQINPNAGWCDYKPFATCMGLNESSCSLNTTCTWNQDEYSEKGGWCDVACFNWSLNSTDCATAAGGICEYRNMSETCQPEMFMMFGAGDDGKSGCWQYDGNQTACMENSVTCQYQNDTYANNNVSASEFAGWCMGKAEFEHFGDVKGDVIDLAKDKGNAFGINGPENENGVAGGVDILGMGMRVTDGGFNFGAGMFNMSESIICNGQFIQTGKTDNGSISAGTLGSGNSSGSFYWYLDSDENESNGCIAYGGLNSSGYDFMISYVARNTTEGVVETKQLMRCVSGEWSPTNALVTTSKKMSCGEIGGVMVAVDAQDLEAFAEFDETSNLKIFMSSANESDTRQNPSDYVGPGYYTPGSIDFNFVDCSDPNTKDPKCKNVQKFGFNVFEECMNGIDDDENGLIDCQDPMCLFAPKCATGEAFDFSAVSGDNTAPIVIYSEVEKLADAAFVRIDTTEPSALNLTFYMNDSACQVENVTIQDIGSGYQDNAKYKPFHNIDLIDYGLVNGTTYYYKTTTCDPSGNCAVSACSNFTTKSNQADKEFIFKIDLPANFTIDIPALNKTGYNFTESFNISGNMTSFPVGIKTNTSVTRDMNMTVHCGDMAIGFFGMNVLGPTKIDLTKGFVCDEDSDMMGMNSSLKKWNKLIDELHLGGAADYIELTLPVAYSVNNVLNWSDESGDNGTDVTSYVNCSAGDSSNTVCKVPVSMGFSAYSITTPSAVVSDEGSSSGGGGGGSGIAITNITVANESVNEVVDDNNKSDIPREKSDIDEAVSGSEVITDFAKKIGLRSIITILISLAVVGGVVWYSLKDKRNKFIEVRAKKKK